MLLLRKLVSCLVLLAVTEGFAVRKEDSGQDLLRPVKPSKPQSEENDITVEESPAELEVAMEAAVEAPPGKETAEKTGEAPKLAPEKIIVEESTSEQQVAIEDPVQAPSGKQTAEKRREIPKLTPEEDTARKAAANKTGMIPKLTLKKPAAKATARKPAAKKMGKPPKPAPKKLATEVEIRRSIESTVSLADQQEIVHQHNLDRENVVPKAMDMRRMYWSKSLASAAQALANECRTDKHDDPAERRNNSGLNVPVGQNYALGPSTTGWLNVIHAWHNEVNDFNYGISTSSDLVVGHYTQEVRGPSGLIGCGSNNCPELGGRSFYCNYQFPNMDYIYPYLDGDSCNMCTDHCYEGLCDCGPINCQNGGLLNLTTCQCQCHNGFTGEFCSECPPVEESNGCRNGHYLTEDCPRFSNVPDVCPILCGQCPDACHGMSNSHCKNGGTLTRGCDCLCITGFTGPQCECASATLMAAKSSDADGVCGTDEYPYAYPATRQWCKYSGVVAMCPQMCNKVWCGTWTAK